MATESMETDAMQTARLQPVVTALLPVQKHVTPVASKRRCEINCTRLDVAMGS